MKNNRVRILPQISLVILAIFCFNNSLSAEKYYIYDFTADWCGPCQKMEQDVWPDLEVRKSIDKFDGIWEFDSDDKSPSERAYFTRYNVTSIPTIIIVDNKGNTVKRGGSMNKGQMLQFLNGVVND